MDTNESQKLYQEASHLYQSQAYDEALNILDRLTAVYPNERKILFAKALCLAALGRPSEALGICDVLIAAHADPKAQKLRNQLTLQSDSPAVPPQWDSAPGLSGPATCIRHPNIPASARCEGCAEAFCDNCLVTIQGRRYCGSCKTLALDSKDVPPPLAVASIPCKEAKEALIASIVGIFCFGILLGPLAISKAMTARKMIAANPNLTGSGMATAGLILGIIDLIGWALGMIARVNSLL